MVSITRNEERKARENEGWEGGWKAEFCRNGVREESVLNLIVFAFFPRGKEISFPILQQQLKVKRKHVE